MVRGAHPRAYHKFVEVLCNYITERHRSSQGQELQAAEVYVRIILTMYFYMLIVSTIVHNGANEVVNTVGNTCMHVHVHEHLHVAS